MFFHKLCFFCHTNNMKRKYLMLIPIFILLSISIYYLPDTYRLKQLLWIAVGLFILLIFKFIKPSWIKKTTWLFYIICNLLLIFVLFYSKFTNGSRGWIEFKYFSLQPSELTKISLILISNYLVSKKNKHPFIYLILFLIPSILTFLEPDTGAVIIYAIIFLSYLKYFFKPKTIKYFLLIFTIILSSFTILYYTNHKLFINLLGTSMYYRIDRITSFKENNNLQTTNALISIGSNKTMYFPEKYNDFFFSYILSNNIYISIIIILSYIILLYLLLKYNSLTSTTWFYILLFQVLENMSMNLSLLPVIGIPLPFLSYGGSHIICSFIILSLVFKEKKKSISYS